MTLIAENLERSCSSTKLVVKWATATSAQVPQTPKAYRRLKI